MYLHRSTVGIVVQAPAKLNLFFEVLAKRGDGYHEIETLMVPIDLWDTLYFQEDPSGRIGLDCRRVIGRRVIGQSLIGLGSSTDRSRTGMCLGELPQGAANLVVRAVELLRRRAGVRCGARLRLVKRIPTAAGLGGGSSDAAAALVAANMAWGLGWSRTRLARVAAELGSDVPFFLGRGPAVCRGRGERVEPIAGLGALHFVVVHPPAGLATADVYDRCRPARHARPLAPILRALAEGDLPGTGRLMFNRLQPAAKQLCRWIGELERELERQDCLGYLMSGSGTCCFGLCRHARHAKRVAGRLQADGIGLARAVRGSK
jgi:4-diphosphocytidyl-2-C-methyl-D-erythritol kinase